MPFVPIIRLLAITPKEDGAYIYLHQVIRGMKFKKNGSVQQQLTVPEISFIEIPYPHSSVLHEYNKVASPIVEMIERNISENDILTKQRDELLPLLMNGQATINYHLSEFTSVFCQVVQCFCLCVEYRALSIGALTIAQLLSNFSKVGIHRAFIFEHLGRFALRPS